MNQRSNDILYDIVNGNFGTINNYAEKFEVSTRTIRNDIKQINQELENKNHQLLVIGENGQIKFNSGDINIQVVESIFKEYDYYTYRLSPQERKTILAMILMNANDFLTVSKLTDLLLVSRNTLLNDLDELKSWFSENDLTLKSYTRKGFRLKGLESDIRKGMMQLCMINGDMSILDEENQSILSKFLLQEIDKNNVREYILDLIRQVEIRHEVILTSFSYKRLAYSFLVKINRILSGNIIEVCDKELSENMKKSSKYDMAVDIMQNVSEKFGIEIHQSELDRTVEMLRGESYIKNNGRKIAMIDVRILINEFIYKVSKSLNINYYLDFYLYDLLIVHLEATVNRVKQDKYIENPLRDQIMGMYPYVIDVIKEHISSLENNLNVKFNEHEISFIAMYIISIMEKNNAKDTTVKVVISCTTGQGTAQLLATRLQTYCKQVQISDIVSPHRLDDIDDDYDLIISTIALKNQENPWIQVNPLLPENDLYEVQKIIVQIQDSKLKNLKYKKVKTESESDKKKDDKVQDILGNKNQKFINLISDSRIKLDVNASDWKDAVIKSGELLYRDNFITEEYIESMITNIEKNGPYSVIYPGVAIPHAQPEDGSLKVGASFMRLKEPVKFNHDLNDPVKYVIAFSIKDTESIGRPLYNLTEMLGTGTFVEALDSAKDEKEILEIISYYEDLVTNK